MFHLFVLKSNIALKLKHCQGVIITLLDLIKFFDKPNLVDVCDALYTANVNKKCYGIWYKLNENTQIEVRTGSGVSARWLAGLVTGQGGGGAALASALNLDKGLQNYFNGSTDKDSYRTVRLQPSCYVDDVNRSSPYVNCMRAGFVKFESLAAGKKLQYHQKIHVFLFFVQKATKQIQDGTLKRSQSC